MCNPAVITLAHVRTKIGEFQVEDNLGEAIHFHVGEIRCDLTIREFEQLADDVGIALERFIKVKGFSINNFSTEFLFQLAENDMLSELVSVEEDTIMLDDIRVDTYNWIGMPTLKPLRESRIIKALNGKASENNRHEERNYYGETNQQRLDSMLDSIKTNGYPHNGETIVLLKGNNKIYDGQHRAACMLYLWGNKEIPILRLEFSNYNFDKAFHIKETVFYYLRKIKLFAKYIIGLRISIPNWFKAKSIRIGYKWDRYRFKNIK